MHEVNFFYTPKYFTVDNKKTIINKVQSILSNFIRIYQSLNIFPPSCRFYPSCSEYARIVIERFNLSKALILILKRIIRCHPFNPGGVDYPPI